MISIIDDLEKGLKTLTKERIRFLKNHRTSNRSRWYRQARYGRLEANIDKKPKRS
jgi:hypothetical protein